jgi:RNA polymerase sigma factor (sigma-70 family)
MDTDLTLLSRYHRQRDAQAFQTLVESHAAMVHATACRVTQDAALAKDVAQETFLALARGSGSAVRCVGAWLHQAAWRKACMLVRSESCRHRYEAAAAEHLHTQPDATWAELEPVLDEALAELPETVRTLLIERFLEGRTQQEIAKRIGLSQSTVSRQIDQGISELQMKLRSRGVIVSAVALTALLGANAMQALPAALAATFGKIALSGVGTAAVSSAAIPWITSLFMKATTIKVALAAAVLTMAWVGHDLASPQPKLHHLFGRKSSEVSATGETGSSSGLAGEASTAKAVTGRSQGSSAVSPVAAPTGKLKPAGKRVSAEVLARFSALSREKDFKDFVTKLSASGDPSYVAAEIQRLLGLPMRESDVAKSLSPPLALELMILGHMAIRQPEETLAWMATYQGDLRSLGSYVLDAVRRRHPDITAENLETLLPAGPGREQILSYFRAQGDPLTEVRQVLATVTDSNQRRQRLWNLAESWPKDQTQAGVEWALKNLTGKDLQNFLPRMAHHLASSAPDEALALLARIQDPTLLKYTLVDTMHGLVREHRRMDDVLHVTNRLEGKDRALALGEICRRWIRVDQEGLLKWINGLESAADFEATLPLTLPQLSPEHYRQVVDNLMTQLDPGLEAALIQTAMADVNDATRTTVDIIGRLTDLPRYQSIGSGQSGNQALLWKAVNVIAERWVQYQGAAPQSGAQWIDSLTFRTPADKAVVVGKLYQQWKVSDPAAAAQWAATAGVKLQ